MHTLQQAFYRFVILLAIASIGAVLIGFATIMPAHGINVGFILTNIFALLLMPSALQMVLFPYASATASMIVAGISVLCLLLFLVLYAPKIPLKKFVVLCCVYVALSSIALSGFLFAHFIA